MQCGYGIREDNSMTNQEHIIEVLSKRRDEILAALGPYLGIIREKEELTKVLGFYEREQHERSN
jgi:hypothetical protein